MPRTASLAGLAILAALSLPARSIASNQSSSGASGSFRLASGLTAQYDYHFDRNAVRDCRRSGGSLIALSDSGNLLRFDLAALRLTREWFGPSPAACLAQRSNGELIVGIADGRVCRIDPESLTLTELTRLASKPAFIAFRAGDAPGDPTSSLVAVVEGMRQVKQAGRSYDVPHSIVHDLMKKKTYALEERATAFLLDGKNRLWLGTDRGEWGGSCSRVDLTAGVIHSLAGAADVRVDQDHLLAGRICVHRAS